MTDQHSKPTPTNIHSLHNYNNRGNNVYNYGGGTHPSALDSVSSNKISTITPSFSLNDEIEFEQFLNSILMILTTNTSAIPFKWLRLWQRILAEFTFAQELSCKLNKMLQIKAIELDMETVDPNQPLIYQVIAAYLLKNITEQSKFALHILTIAAKKLNYQPAQALLLRQEIHQHMQQGAFDHAILTIEKSVYDLGKTGLKLAVEVFETIAQCQFLGDAAIRYCYQEALKYSFMLQTSDEIYASKHITQNMVKGHFTHIEANVIKQDATNKLPAYAI